MIKDRKTSDEVIDMVQRLLLVEDDQSLIDGLHYALEKEGYQLTVAQTAAAARQRLEREVFDLLLLDITLPDGSGVALCEWLRSQGSVVPVIFLTALDEEVHVIRALDSGGDDYITKPFRLGELCSRIRAQLRRGAALAHRETVLAGGGLRIEGGRASLDGAHTLFREQRPCTDADHSSGAVVGRSGKFCR